MAYVTAGYLCKLVDLDEASLVLHPADPGSNAKSILKKLVSKGLLYGLDMGLEALLSAHTADSTWAFMLVQSKSQVDVFLATRDGLLGRTSGRGPEISEKTAQKVWADAGARCMFEGCAHDLSEIALWTKAARVGYLAHIVASDPEGPRGEIRELKLSLRDFIFRGPQHCLEKTQNCRSLHYPSSNHIF